MTAALPHPDLPVGSADYYAARFTPAPFRARAGAILAWGRTLERVGADTTDPGVARLKLQWWAEEVERAARSRPAHPLAVELGPVLRRHPEAPARCVGLIETLDRTLGSPAAESLEELGERSLSTRGALLELTALAGGANADEAAAARRMGAAVGLIRLIRDLGGEIRRGRCPLPPSLLAAHELPPQPGLDERTRDRLPRVLAELGGQAADLHRNAWAGLTPGGHPALATAAALGEIHRDLLGAMEETGYRLVDQRIALTPIRKLWRALRAARRARRGPLFRRR